VSPHFTVMDSRTEQELLAEARTRLFNRAQWHDPVLQDALSAMARRMSENSFNGLISELIGHKRKLRSLFSAANGVEAAIEKVWQFLQLSKDTSIESLCSEHFAYDKNAAADLRRVVERLLAGDEKEQKTGQGIADWLEGQTKREQLYMDYIHVMLTLQGTPRQRLFKKATITDEALIAALKAEQERVWRFHNDCKSFEIASQTIYLLHIAEALLALYDAQKNARGLMDYDDLILAACALLQRPGIAPWVLFKLDGGIDHILVDEAQDTSPEQWIIIDALTQEFFAGLGRKEWNRSLFVVGDEKQSIYSFQGADPAGLSRMQQYFSRRIREAAKPVHHIALMRSFRSTREVLAAVDAIFSRPQAKDGLMSGDAELTHILTREGQPGLVELWPLVRVEEDSAISPTTQLVRHIADNIKHWLRNGTAEAGDIMILVRSRTTLVDRLVRALKKRGVPVAGQDRMRLSDNLAVQDLIALGQCLLLPEDDLTLAALLKSPIFNVSEEELFQLAWQREGSLFERFKSHEAYPLFADLRGKADFISPYELYSYVLETCGARRRFTGRMGEEYHDPIDEFLGQALLYERSHPPSLQGFLHWLNASDSEIKRDMEQSENAVRIMTVHGAKGLQAPIVILPDTVEMPKLRDSLLWHGNAHPFWSGASAGDDAFCASLRDDERRSMQAEYRRLLYVALTRAEDRLYICGATSKEKINEQCWYQLAHDGLAGVAAPFDMPWGEGLRLGTTPSSFALSKGSPSIARDPSVMPKDDDDFSFLTRPAPSEPTPPQPLVPSRLAGEEPASASPLAENGVYQRGKFIHALLQHLPGLPQEQRARAIAHITASTAKKLPDELVQKSIREVLAIMENPEFAFLFGADSMAEVPVAGLVDIHGKPVAVAGQIDRLAITGEDVWIIDYKSNRAPPERIPLPYLRQMQLYRVLLQEIYPGKAVCCGLLWTSAPKLTVLDEALLDEVSPSSYI